MKSRIRFWPAFVPMSLATMMTMAGCQSATPPASQPQTTAASKASDSPAKPEANQPAEPDETDVRADASGQKWIDGIPYDVFFDDPLTVAANATPTGTAPAAPNAMAASSSIPSGASGTPATQPPPASSESGGGAADWKSLISMEQLNNEAKRIRNHLTASLQSQGTYNGNYTELQVDGAVVAAIAMVAAEHSEDASWKKNARYLREFGAQLREASKSLGRDSFTASQTAAENIQAVLNGNLPAEAGDPAANKPYAEAASRAGVMKRIEKASEWMRANINSQQVFDTEIEQIKQESAVLAALAKMIGDHSYDSADEEEYAGFAKDLLNGAQGLGAAATEKDYSKFTESMNKVQKACGECHLNYGNG